MADPFGGVFKSSTASQSKSAGTSLKKSQQIQQQAASAATASGAQKSALNTAAMYKELGYEMDETMRQEQAALAKEELELQNKALELDAKTKVAGMKNKATIAQMKADSQEKIAGMQAEASKQAAKDQAADQEAAAAQQISLQSKKFALNTTTSMYSRAIKVAAAPETSPEAAYKASTFALEMSNTLGATYGSPEFTNSLNAIGQTLINSGAQASGNKDMLIFTGTEVALDPSVYNGYQSAMSLSDAGLYDTWYGLDGGFTSYYDGLVESGQKMTTSESISTWNQTMRAMNDAMSVTPSDIVGDNSVQEQEVIDATKGFIIDAMTLGSYGRDAWRQ